MRKGEWVRMKTMSVNIPVTEFDSKTYITVDNTYRRQ